MYYNIETLLTELRATIADLGKGGGSISPSVYDTAQVLRLFPPEDPEPAFQWLLAQQKADGGWGSPETPYARDVPTLAAVLALRTYRQDPIICEAIDASLTFLQRGAEKWAELSIDALPIAAEVILPYLIEEANRSLGFMLDPTPYAAVYRLRKKKLQQLSKIPLRIGSPPTYSWEALDQDVYSILPDHSGGIGHSPAATAAWLRQAIKYPDLAKPCVTAKQYLTKAARSTGLGIAGVVPNVWPIVGFELGYAPYALLITGTLQQPTLQDTIAPILDDLSIIMERGRGVSFGEYFTPDVDVTGVALAVLQATRNTGDSDLIFQFKNGNHFYTYQYELNPSVFSNAHALYALASVNKREIAIEKFLIERQCTNGRWQADKWHSSWLYTTLEVILTLDKLGYISQVRRALEAFIHSQKADGGWGSGQFSTRIETSYALIALLTLQQRGILKEEVLNAMQRGYQWLSRKYKSNHSIDNEALWLGKELYTPHRVDRIYELTTLLAMISERISV